METTKKTKKQKIEKLTSSLKEAHKMISEGLFADAKEHIFELWCSRQDYLGGNADENKALDVFDKEHGRLYVKAHKATHQGSLLI